MSLPILKKFIGANQIDETKVLFNNNSFFRAKKADTTEKNIFKLNASDKIEFADEVIVPDATVSGAAVNKGQLDAVSTAISDHLNDTVDAHDASAISVVPAGNLSATTVQAALEELQTDIDGITGSTALTDHINDTVDAHDASAISVLDTANNFTGTDVESVLAEINDYVSLHTIQDDGSVAMAASLNLGSNKIINLANPTSLTDAVNKDSAGGFGVLSITSDTYGGVYSMTATSERTINISLTSAFTVKLLPSPLRGDLVTIKNTGSGAGAITVQDSAGGAISGGIVQPGSYATLRYNGTAWGATATLYRQVSTSTYSFASNRITNLADPTSAQDGATKFYVDAKVTDAIVDGVTTVAPSQNAVFDALALKEDKNGTANFIRVDGTNSMGADLNLSGNKIMNVVDPTDAQHAATKNYVDTQDALKVSKAGDSMSGNLAMGGNQVIGLGAPVNANDAIRLVDLQNAQAGMDYQANVDGIQVDNTLVPVLTAGKRYIITNSASLHANFGSIAGLGDGDIVEYDGSAFVIMVDVSTKPAGSLILVGNRADDQQYEWKQSTGLWDIFYGFSANAAGIGLSLSGNVLNINLGAGIAELPSDEVGIDVHSAGALMLTVDNSASSTSNAAQLAVKLDGSTLAKSVDGLKVNQIADAQIASAAAIDLTKLAALAPGYAVRSNDSTGFLEISSVTNTELGYVSGVTSPIQGQIDSKASASSLSDYLNRDGSASVTGNLLPDVSGSRNLGSASNIFGIAYLNEINLYDGSNALYGSLGNNAGGIQISAASGEVKLNGTAIDASSLVIKNVANPSSAQDAATKDYVDTAVAAFNQTFVKESVTLSATDISNGYVDLANEAVANSLAAFIGRLAMHQTEDYTLSVVSGKTRVTFGSLIGAGVEAPVEGDKLFFTYAM